MVADDQDEHMSDPTDKQQREIRQRLRSALVNLNRRPVMLVEPAAGDTGNGMYQNYNSMKPFPFIHGHMLRG